MIEEDEEDFKNNNNCRFCEKNIEFDKVRDHCHLTGENRGPAHSICKINVTQDQSIFIPFVFHNFSNHDCHMFFKKLVDKKNVKVEFIIIPNTDEDYISARYGCIRFIDSYRFLSKSLHSLVKTLVDNSHKTLKDLEKEIVDNDEILNIVNEIKIVIKEDRYNNDSIIDSKKECTNEIEKLEEVLNEYMGENDLKILKTEFPDKWKHLTKKLAYPYEYFNSIDDYPKPVDNLNKEDFFSKLDIDYSSEKEIERTIDINKRFDIKVGKEITQM